MPDKTRVLFVCLGNICRSPLAEGLFLHHLQTANLLDAYDADSAGTGAWHVGNPPDPRSIAVAAVNGVDITQQRAQQVEDVHFSEFDYLVGMDHSNVARLKRLAPAGSAATVRMLFEHSGQDVPDPYFGGNDGFQRVFDMVFQGTKELLDELESKRKR